MVLSHEQIDGSANQRRLVFERGDSVAVLLLNLDTKSVVLVEQLTVPVQMARRREVRQRRGAQSAGERAVRSVTLSLFRRRQPLSRRKECYLNAVREALKG